MKTEGEEMDARNEEKRAQLLARCLEGGELAPGELELIADELGAGGVIRTATRDQGLDSGFDARLRTELVILAEDAFEAAGRRLLPAWLRNLAAAAALVAVLGLGFLIVRQHGLMAPRPGTGISSAEVQQRLDMIEARFHSQARPAFITANSGIVTAGFSGGVSQRIITRQRDLATVGNDRFHRQSIFERGSQL